MKKMLKWWSGDEESIEVDMDGQLFGFCVGDIISDTMKTSWYKQRVVVEGFDKALSLKRIWGTIEGNDQSMFSISPNGLILLERPNRTFKVGDRVYVSIWNEEGKIVVMNPYNSSTPYLVEYDTEGIEHQEAPWFPKEYSNLTNKKMVWCSEKILSPLLG